MMKLRIAVLLLAATFPILQSVRFDDCCCGVACPEARAAVATSSPCCDEEGQSPCTHIEPLDENCVLDAVALPNPVPTTIVDAAFSIERQEPAPGNREGPLQDTGPPVFLRLRTLRL